MDTENEINKLRMAEDITRKAVNAYARNHPYEVSVVEREQILTYIARLFNGEMDYLQRNPGDYHALYNDN